jgi:hypothetical protein
MKKYFLFASLLMMGCAGGGQSGDYAAYLKGKGLQPTTLEKFSHCRAYGCQKIDTVSLNKQEWRAIEKAFKPKPKNAEAERQRISKAIGVFETKVGAITGTEEDVGNTFSEFGPHQLDCVDESTNTTVYLALLQEKGLLKFHEVSAPTSRVPFVHYAGTWPHQTAVILEKNRRDGFYAVDSWFHDNGIPAEIVPLKEWKSGWRPEKVLKKE